MRRCPKLLLLPSLAAIAGAQPLPKEPRYINSRDVVLSFGASNAVRIDQVRLWVSRDGGETWTETPVRRTGDNAARFDAQSDGKYGLYMVLENKAGASGDPPVNGTAPQSTAIIDTRPPTMQIHRARQTTAADGHPRIRLNVSLVEENSGESAARMFYRTDADSRWLDGGTVIFSDGIIDWKLPPNLGPSVDLRLLVTDLAGNQAIDEIRNVTCTLTFPEGPSATASHAQSSPIDGAREIRAVTIPPLEPPTVAPVPAVTAADAAPPAPTSQPSFVQRQQAKHLRTLAARYVAEGRLGLAGARFQEALTLTPDDPDLQVDLGNVLYCTRQYDQAIARFQGALADSPDHRGAIEGLALVAATQNRYPQAREHLQHLLRLDPRAGKHWLHYGDIEHLLGNATDAYTAWEKAYDLAPPAGTVRAGAQERLKLFGQQHYRAK